MPLGKPAPRDLLHTRHIECHGYKRDDGLWDIEGSIVDRKTYSFANQDRGGVRAGEAVHDMSVRLTIDDNMVVRGVEATTAAAPFSMCGDITDRYESLVGLRIGPGWRRAIAERLGGVRGCTHVSDMILGPLAVTAFQTLGSARASGKPAGDTSRPGHLNTCHALSSDSPVVRRRWPQHYTGE